MSQQELLTRVVQVLADAGVEYMVTGSIASSLHGQPRSTHDIDIVIALSAATADKLIVAFPPPEYYLSAEAVSEAIRRQSMFNLLHLTTGEKVDFWLLTDEPFDQARFRRRRTDAVLGLSLKVSSPEDTILAKLRWAKLSGGSEKQVTDALHVFELQRDDLDIAYLSDWSQKLGVEELWQRLQGEAEPI